MRVLIRAQVPVCAGRILIRAQAEPERLSNPREFFKLTAWVERNKLSSADSEALAGALREVRHAFPEFSAGEAIGYITRAYEGDSDVSKHPWIDISQDIDWPKLQQRAEIEKTMRPKVEEAYETIKAARELGLIGPEELRRSLNLVQLAERVPSKARVRYESQIRDNEQELERLRKQLEEARHITKPVFKVGQVVIYQGRPATVSDIDIKDSTWVYSVTQDVADFLAKTGELTAAPPTTPLPKPRVAVTPELQARVFDAYASALADLGIPSETAKRVAEQQQLEILSEVRVARDEMEAERIASVLASEYYRRREEEQMREKKVLAPTIGSGILGPVFVPGAVRVRVTYSDGTVVWSGVLAQSTARGIQEGTLRFDPTARVQWFPPDTGPPVEES